VFTTSSTADHNLKHAAQFKGVQVLNQNRFLYKKEKGGKL